MTKLTMDATLRLRLKIDGVDLSLPNEKLRELSQHSDSILWPRRDLPPMFWPDRHATSGYQASLIARKQYEGRG